VRKEKDRLAAFSLKSISLSCGYAAADFFLLRRWYRLTTRCRGRPLFTLGYAQAHVSMGQGRA